MVVVEIVAPLHYNLRSVDDADRVVAVVVSLMPFSLFAA